MSKRKVDVLVEAKKSKKPTLKTPKTLKEKILHLLATEDAFVSLPAMKKLLRENYDLEESTASNNKLNKTLKALLEENRDDFGKIGGSYHCGKKGTAFREYETQRTANELKAEEDKLHEDDEYAKCPFCLTWCDMNARKSIDSIYRGSIFKCSEQSCKKKFYTWPTDGYKMGHEIEYKNSEDYRC